MRDSSTHTESRLASTALTPIDLELDSGKFPAYRPGQERAFLAIAEDNHRFTLLSAPTGAGKSLIYVSVAQMMEYRTLILVGTKGLQSQLHDDFHTIGARDIRGHRNYPCAIPDAGFDEPLCSLPPEKCYYKIDVEQAREANIVISNFAYWMSLARYSNPALIGDFDLIVLDEAHTVPDWLTSFCSITINASDIRSLLGLNIPYRDLDDVSAWSSWAKDSILVAQEKYKQLPGGNVKSIRHQKISRMIGDFTTLSQVPSTDIQWAAQRVQRGAEFSPVWAHPYAEQYLFRGVERIILCSATITPAISKYLGIGKDEYGYIEVESSFSPKRRPLIYIPTTRVDSRMGEGEKRILQNRIDSTIESRLGRKGIIHSRSYKNAMDVYHRSRYKEFMLVHSTDNAREIIEKFRNAKPPCILVSPSVEEGYDFPGDMCLWQIIYKIPFLDTRTGVQRIRADQDKGYGIYIAANDLIQSTGRGMRSENDICECVSPETRILTDDLRWIQAGNLSIGDRLLSVDEHSNAAGRLAGPAARRRWRWSYVEKSKISIMPRMRVVTDREELICTPNHPWLVYGRGNRSARMLIWRRTDELTTDDKLVLAIEPWTIGSTWEHGWSSGFTDGEGCLVLRHGKRNPNCTGIYISQVEGEVLEFAKKTLKNIGYTFSVHTLTNNPSYKQGYNLRLVGGYPEILRFMGQIRPLRLLKKFTNSERNEQLVKSGLSKVFAIEKLNDGDICSLQTSTKTYIAEGFVAHNTFIFDDHWKWFVNKSQFPRWFRDSFTRSYEIPEPIDLTISTSEYNSGHKRSIRDRR